VIAGPEDIAAAVQRLKSGGVVAFPTETVYGLGADARNASAVRRVFQLKGRPSHNPLIVHVAGVAGARSLTREWPPEADALARAFWPGPLTLVLPRGAGLPDEVTAGSPNVAVRSPDHPTALALLVAFDGPLVGPSANPSGRVSPTTADHVRGAFDPADVLVLDGGPCRAGIESTVLRLAGGRAEILRPGLVTPAQIAAIIGRTPVVAGDAAPGEPLDSPGLLRSHYAPRHRAVLTPRAQIAAEVARAGGGVVVLLLPGEGSPPRGAASVIQMPGSAVEYAARLYAALREADALEPTVIVIEEPAAVGPDAGAWEAILDRLRRACA
jgi:L-threonylcarbamoyladenylate synthase